MIWYLITKVAIKSNNLTYILPTGSDETATGVSKHSFSPDNI